MAMRRLLKLPEVDAVSIATERTADGRVDVSFELTLSP
jgi:hypothetical protein